MTCRRHVPFAHQYGIHQAVALSAVLLMMVALGGCRRGLPAMGRASEPATSGGTLSGTVRAPQGATPVEGRLVEVVNVASGERHRAVTNSAGGFSFKVKPGRYRVELALRDGERLVKQPGTVDVNRSEVDAEADFILGTAPVSKPRGPANRVVDGLGSPVA